MTFITARNLRLNPKDVWGKLKREGDLIITLNGRPCAILTDITSESIEDAILLIKRIKAEIAVSKLRSKSCKRGLDKLTQKQIEKEIKISRETRR